MAQSLIQLAQQIKETLQPSQSAAARPELVPAPDELSPLAAASSPQAHAFRMEIIDVGRKLWERQYVDGNGGNISVRLGQRYLLCTPTMMSKRDMEPADICLSDLDGNILAGDRLRTRSAHPVHGHRRDIRRQASLHRCLASRIHLRSGLDHLAHDHSLYRVGFDLCARQHILDDCTTELRRRNFLQGTIIRADSRTLGTAKNDLRLSHDIKPFANSSRYTINWPPLALMVAPVINAAESLTRKLTIRATSSGVPKCPTGIWLPILDKASWGIAATISVLM